MHRENKNYHVGSYITHTEILRWQGSVGTQVLTMEPSTNRKCINKHQKKPKLNPVATLLAQTQNCCISSSKTPVHMPLP